MKGHGTSGVSPGVVAAVERLMRRVEDFPVAGVQFCDLTPVLADPEGFDAVVAGLAAGHEIGSVDYVAGLDARGFLLAGAVALRLRTGVLAIRKAGKLPPPVHSRSYELEYGAATLELPADGLDLSGTRILVVDDVLATGGTLGAAVGLLDDCGAVVTGLSVVLEVPGLGGRDRLSGTPLTCLTVA
ncbi:MULTISPECIES: adenine phosphoribosyltransferase [unclassified Dietzia]|uniref:adenine phosphoribosyltransferase n=1 Tax=unclassified Dietzia TaxID=2617939 RepID=UPI000D2089E8|nr:MULTISPECIES: adenine phosphoribosyltransferase [unclassified Dietzia]AVZ39509.1 adenine phosphoribosyltransferase [Dietzia sp. JS16-p6b]MBB1023278.1 adenine phosphoribosyltransferase [Dietzia sp. DQ12-76]MBB1028936.1 adenine phosphoribosyltransferase [Dietzia sp. DQ11-38-2]